MENDEIKYNIDQVQHTYRKFVKGHGFVSFAENMGKNIVKNINKSLSGKYSPGMLAMH